MRTRLLIPVGLLALGLVLGPAPAQGEAGRLSMSFQRADIHQVISVIAKVSGANIIVGPEVQGSVTLYLNDVHWRDALDAAIKSIGCRVIEEDSGVLRVMPTGITFLPQTRGQAPSRGYKSPDRYTLIGPKNFLTGYPAINADETVNAVIEIPAGTIAKWEVTKGDGVLRWEFENRKPREVQYLGYPANYGMVPRTVLSEDRGGDGDPVDVVVLGPAIPRGNIARVRIIGVVQLLDDGEQDDKLLAVSSGTPFADVKDIGDLERDFPGVTSILTAWFSNYKGPGRIEVKGLGGAVQALEILKKASAEFER